ncbi:MAG: hypothetical protein ACREP1_02625, partial [Rhodanobacteraceae bacterium]
MELVTTLLHRLSQRGPYAAALVAQEAQQADRRPAQRDRRIEVSRHVCRGEAHRKPDDQHHPRPD